MADDNIFKKAGTGIRNVARAGKQFLGAGEQIANAPLRAGAKTADAIRQGIDDAATSFSDGYHGRTRQKIDQAGQRIPINQAGLRMSIPARPETPAAPQAPAPAPEAPTGSVVTPPATAQGASRPQTVLPDRGPRQWAQRRLDILDQEQAMGTLAPRRWDTGGAPHRGVAGTIAAKVAEGFRTRQQNLANESARLGLEARRTAVQEGQLDLGYRGLQRDDRRLDLTERGQDLDYRLGEGQLDVSRGNLGVNRRNAETNAANAIINLRKLAREDLDTEFIEVPHPDPKQAALGVTVPQAVTLRNGRVTEVDTPENMAAQSRSRALRSNAMERLKTLYPDAGEAELEGYFQQYLDEYLSAQ